MSSTNKKYTDQSYPTINFIGNKAKITDWIIKNVPSDVKTFFDAFSGGASVSFAAKKNGLETYTNDVLVVNYNIALALIENDSVVLDKDKAEKLFEGKPFSGYFTNTYKNLLYFEEECKQLDLIRENINELDNKYEISMALSLMRRAMIRKMPYSRFNIKWDKIKQLRDEDFSYEKYGRKRAYHNDSFKNHFLASLDQYNSSVFSNGKHNLALNKDIFEAVKLIDADLIYLDPPYSGTMNNYFSFYSALDNYAVGSTTNPFTNSFTAKDTTIELFDKLFSEIGKYKYWMMSYNSSSYPSKEVILELMEKYGRKVKVLEKKHDYKITGKIKKKTNTEYLYIAEAYNG